ncbi:hypothetical protein F7725_028346, partial [Dissostichus mawsoni]
MHNEKVEKKREILNRLVHLMGETIKEEISKAPFVALMLDPTSELSNAVQFSFVVRFATVALVFTVFEKKDALKDLFDDIVDHHEEFDDSAIL